MSNKTLFHEWTDLFPLRDYKMSKYQKNTAKSVDNTIKFCTKCSRCWESWIYSSRPEWVKYGKNHIPTLNKSRETCPDCEPKGKGLIYKSRRSIQ